MAQTRVLLALAAASCIATSCSSSSAAPESRPTDRPVVTPSSAEPSPPSLPAGTSELAADEGARLQPGRYVKTDFSPRLSFQLSRGWHAGHDIAGFFDVQRRQNSLDVIAVQFAVPFDATSATKVIRELRQEPGLKVTDRGRVTIGGRTAHEVLIDSRNPRLTPARYSAIFSTAAGSLYIGSGRRLLVDFVETGHALLAVLVGGSVRSWDAATRAATPVLRSIRFV
jgi:hypothetical protein